MTLENLLLERLAEWRPAGRATTALDDAGSGWRAVLDAEAVDGIGCRLWGLRLERLQPLPAAVPLREQAEGLARRVTGLLEPLRVVEIDQDRGVAQLRSDAPALKGGGRHYYEVERRECGTTEVQRYQGGSGPRRAVPFDLTHEAAGKLVRDAAA